MNINIKKLDKNAKIPTRADAGAAGYDLYACYTPTNNGENNYDSVLIPPHERRFIHTGVAMAIPEGYFGGIYARSGLSCKKGLRPANCTGVIDSSYRNDITVVLFNDSDQPREVKMGERVAQLVIQPYETVMFNPVEALSETERGLGGFGSSGK